MKILLLQFRNDQSQQHEVDCIAKYTGLSAEEIVVHDFLQGAPDINVLDSVDAVICGGANAYRISHNDMPYQSELLAFVRTVVDRSIPYLGLCYGAHTLAAAVGGVVEYRPQNKEVSTVPIYRLQTAAGDELFDDAPAEFLANCGRTDDIMELPVHCLPLANSDNSQFHAFRVIGKPVYATQFHAELGQKENRERMEFAFAHAGYFEDRADLERTQAAVQETPYANSVVKAFIDRIVKPHAAE